MNLRSLFLLNYAAGGADKMRTPDMDYYYLYRGNRMLSSAGYLYERRNEHALWKMMEHL